MPVGESDEGGGRRGEASQCGSEPGGRNRGKEKEKQYFLRLYGNVKTRDQGGRT